MSPRWTMVADVLWLREDGVRLSRLGHESDADYVWRATRPTPDTRGRSTFDVEAPNVFVAMDDVDSVWPAIG